MIDNLLEKERRKIKRWRSGDRCSFPEKDELEMIKKESGCLHPNVFLPLRPGSADDVIREWPQSMRESCSNNERERERERESREGNGREN